MAKKVKTKWLVSVPEGAKILVNLGQEVEADQELVEMSDGEIQTVNISERLKGLSNQERLEMGEMVPGMKIVKDEVIYKTKGFFPKKVGLPVSGELIKIDEFENLHYKEQLSEQRKITSPVKAKVIKKESGLVELEFRATEYGGRGISEGRAWGNKGLDYVGDISQLSSQYSDKIIMTEVLDQTWLVKAEVVGVKGVIVIDSHDESESDRINSKLPILALENNEWQELKKDTREFQRAMVNAAKGRLLLVV